MKYKSALVLSSRAADFVCSAGGVIAAHSKNEYEMIVVCMGIDDPVHSDKLGEQEDLTLPHVKMPRREEAQEAADCLGVSELIFFNNEDYHLQNNKVMVDRLVDIFLNVQPEFVISPSPKNNNRDHSVVAKMALDARSIVQDLIQHNSREKILDVPQIYLSEPYQPEQFGWKPDTLFDITDVWDKKKAAIECMVQQEGFRKYYKNVAEDRGNQFRRNCRGRSCGFSTYYAEAYKSVFPQNMVSL